MIPSHTSRFRFFSATLSTTSLSIQCICIRNFHQPRTAVRPRHRCSPFQVSKEGLAAGAARSRQTSTTTTGYVWPQQWERATSDVHACYTISIGTHDEVQMLWEAIAVADSAPAFTANPQDKVWEDGVDELVRRSRSALWSRSFGVMLGNCMVGHLWNSPTFSNNSSGLLYRSDIDLQLS